MGFRTVVMLNNDRCGEWENDPDLGKKIAHAMNDPKPTAESPFRRDVGGYGKVVECVHADTNTLAMLSGYTQLDPLAYSQWHKGKSDDEVVLAMLKDAAEKLGFKLVKTGK